MKKLYLFFVVPLFIVSCSKAPQSNFYIEINKAKVGSEVFFINTSENAESYEWDFGDGTYSMDKNPVHIYKTIGTYNVTLSAFSNRKESRSMLSLTVVEPTLLVVEVLEYYDGYSVGNASVILYPTLNDWDNETNAIVEGFTDGDGIVVFGDIAPVFCYVDVWEQNHDNYQLGLEDAGFIEVKVIRDKIQWFIAYVDYYPHTRSNLHGEKKPVIKKIEKREPGRIYPGSSYNGDIDYETLLKKSVVKK
jgi:PKD repeat protein